MLRFVESIKERITDFLRTRRRDKLVSRAISHHHKDEFEEAALIYERIAPECLTESELLASLYHGYAFEEWLNAKEAPKALKEARKVLRMLVANDGKWLTYDAGKNADELVSMVSKLYAAGYLDEGEKLAIESNTNFEKYGLPVRCAAVPVGRSKFPSLCTQCGGTLPPSSFEKSITCTFCETVVYAP
jgi:hypothetical protein